MKILVALDNEKILNDLKKEYSSKVHSYDINYMEGVLEYIKIYNKEDIVLITKDNLIGNLTKEKYLKEIKDIKPNIKVILFVSKIDLKYKEFLLSNEIFNIIESDSINLEQLKECIETNNKIIYKNLDNSNSNIKNELNIIKNKKINSNNYGKIISVYGTSGAGKSYVANKLSKDISNVSKTVLLDFDLENSSQDILSNLEGTGDSLNYIIDELNKKRNINKVINEVIYKKDKLSYITNNTSIYNYQNKFNTSHYSKLYNELKKDFSHIVVDLSSSIFVDVVNYSLVNSDYIVFVLNPNYISIRQTIKYMELLKHTINIDVKKIILVVNKVRKDSLDEHQIKSIIGDLDIALKINFNNDLEGVINGSNYKDKFEIEFCKIYKNIGINNVQNDMVTRKIFSGMLKEKFYLGGKNDNK